MPETPARSGIASWRLRRSDQATSASRSTRPWPERRSGSELSAPRPRARPRSAPSRRAAESGEAQLGRQTVLGGRRRVAALSSPAQPARANGKPAPSARARRAVGPASLQLHSFRRRIAEQELLRVLPQVADGPADLADGPIHVLDQSLQARAARSARSRRPEPGSVPPASTVARRAAAGRRACLQVGEGLRHGRVWPPCQAAHGSHRQIGLLQDRRATAAVVVEPRRSGPAAGRASRTPAPSDRTSSPAAPRRRPWPCTCSAPPPAIMMLRSSSIWSRPLSIFGRSASEIAQCLAALRYCSEGSEGICG